VLAAAPEDEIGVSAGVKRMKKCCGGAGSIMAVSATTEEVAPINVGAGPLTEPRANLGPDAVSAAGVAMVATLQPASKMRRSKRRNLQTKEVGSGAPTCVEAPNLDLAPELQQEVGGLPGSRLSILTSVKQEARDDEENGIVNPDSQSGPSSRRRRQLACADSAERTVRIKLEPDATEGAVNSGGKPAKSRRGRRSEASTHLEGPAAKDIKVEGGEVRRSSTGTAVYYDDSREDALQSPPPSSRAVRRSRTPGLTIRRMINPSEMEGTEGAGMNHGSGGSQPAGDGHPQLALAVSKSIAGRELKEARVMVSKLKGRVTEEEDHSFTHLLIMPGKNL
jgi:hypothetical protein